MRQLVPALVTQRHRTAAVDMRGGGGHAGGGGHGGGTSNQSLRKQAAGCAKNGGAYQLRRFAFCEVGLCVGAGLFRQRRRTEFGGYSGTRVDVSRKQTAMWLFSSKRGPGRRVFVVG